MYISKKIFRFSIDNLKSLLNTSIRNERTLAHFSNSIFEKKRNSPSSKILSQAEREKFRSFFPNIIEDLTSHNQISNVDEVNERVRQILEYCVSGGKQLRPSLFISAYKFIRRDLGVLEENLDDAIKLAWCVEMMSSYFLILDDILDKSEYRRGKLCWYKNEDVGMKAINDGVLIQMGVFHLLKKYFTNHKFYQQIVDVFLEVNLKTFIGQTLDCETIEIRNLSWKKFNDITHNKTGYYTYYFPIVLAMFLAERPDLQLQETAFDIFMELGRFYQFQNDYSDFFDENGTDVQEGKCTWLILRALEKASPSQKKVLEENYGKWDTYCVEKIKNIYFELKINSSYDSDQYGIFREINTHLKKMENSLAQNLMSKLTLVSLGYETYL